MNYDAAPRLLDDAAMQGFIRDGYLSLRSDLPPDFHERMFTALDDLEEGGPRGHNNLLPCVPELSRMLAEPAVSGALASILGPGYYLHFHRHDHFNFPGDAQPLHKDGDNHSHYAVDGLRRMHRTRFAMLFYYPQDTPLEKGPTGIVPRSHYLPRRALEAARHELHQFNQRARREVQAEFGAAIYASKAAQAALRERLARFRAENPAIFEELAKLDQPWEAAKIPLTGDAGTITIVHFDMVHGRYSGNITDQPRHMVKFLFTRDRDPGAPSWHHQSAAWPAAEDPMTPVWQSMWRWHGGAANDATYPATAAELDNDDDRVALGAAYALGARASRDGLGALFERFFSDDVARRTIAAYGLVAAGAAAVPRLRDALRVADAELAVRALDLLGDIGPPAARAWSEVLAAAEHDDVEVRRYAAEAIGTIGQGRNADARTIVSTLASALTDEDALVRRNAALAVARLGPELGAGDELVPILTENLLHWHHHVRGWAIEALQRLGSPRANEAALRYLMTARWDPLPKSGDTPPGAKSPKRVVRVAQR